MKQIPTCLLRIEEQSLGEEQSMKRLSELADIREKAIKQGIFNSVKSFKEMDTNELMYSTIDFLIGTIFSKINNKSQESNYLSSYHFDLFLKLMVKMKLCVKETYRSTLYGTIEVGNYPKVPNRSQTKGILVDIQDRTFWIARLKDLIHSALLQLQTYILQCNTLGHSIDFSLNTYSLNFFELKSVFIGIDIQLLFHDLSEPFNESNDITNSPSSKSTRNEKSLSPPLRITRCKTMPKCYSSRTSLIEMTTKKSVVIPRANEKELVIVNVKGVKIIYRNDVPSNIQNIEREGNIIITSFKFCFIDDSDGKYNIFVPMTKIADFKKVNNNKSEHRRILEFNTKDNIYVKFSFLKNREERKSIFTALNSLVFVPPTSLEIFKLIESIPIKPISYYNVLDEFIRLGLNKSNSNWRVSRINDDYAFCPTYPREIIVPKEASDELLLEDGSFRSRQRIPVITYVSSKGSSISRCSQPLCGLTGRKCQADIELLKMITHGGPSHKLRILDSRPKANAVANIAMGGGYETEEDYPFATIEFESIDNIHVVREGWQKLCWYCMQLPEHYKTSQIINCNEIQQWWKIMLAIFASSIKMCRYLEAGESVLVHCTDGWDRTSQCCSLCEIMLDPFFRTIDGFIILIEKDWKSFGHKFMTRAGVGVHCPHSQYSPVFHQFIECVFILLQQYPTSFQYNEDFLIEIDDAVFCHNYGTFLFDTDCEREKYHVNERTPSLWSMIIENRELFTNHQYILSDNKLHLNGIPKFVLWEKYYFCNRKL
ncbi:myotubularin, putative [Entamoeba histolytica KU27]|uniref:Myotubularin, putative n=1 Tax=Entamoeba histolytica KU27 TaxID=885311 RepID=M2QE62_ENTHI|nr:myotubularin, putative [Entamoeba histolytica KU27]